MIYGQIYGNQLIVYQNDGFIKEYCQRKHLKIKRNKCKRKNN